MRKIDSLTSIRFFASLAIVFMHSKAAFDATSTLAAGWPLHYGVTFFFVLSGFILTYVYRDIPAGSRSDFYVARISRIWPAHLVCLLLLLALLPRDQWIWDGANPVLVPLSNLLLIHSLIPIPGYYFSLNGVSWSISTEMLFYAVFPFLLAEWDKTRFWKVATFGLLVAVIVFAADLFGMPPFSVQNFLKPTAHGMVYISPLARMFEFLLGVVAAKISVQCGLNYNDRVRSFFLWSVLELVLAAIVLYAISFLVTLPGRLGLHGETAVATYIVHSSAAVFFALLIAVLAFEGGCISTVFRFKPLIILGEISFSLYLVHQVILRWYVNNKEQALLGIDDNVRLALYWLLCLMSAYAIWRFIEVPMRIMLRRKLAALLAQGSRNIRGLKSLISA